MKKFEVKYSVDGRYGYSIIVTAKDYNQARRIALGEIQGMAGYVGKRIHIINVLLIRN